jgi:tetratricopeptide (TPR) repeat protein
MLWYQHGPFEAYGAIGRWDDVMALAEANLRNAPNLEESHYWRGRALAARGDLAGARAAWSRALELNPFLAPAREALEEIR